MVSCSEMAARLTDVSSKMASADITSTGRTTSDAAVCMCSIASRHRRFICIVSSISRTAIKCAPFAFSSRKFEIKRVAIRCAPVCFASLSCGLSLDIGSLVNMCWSSVRLWQSIVSRKLPCVRLLLLTLQLQAPNYN